MTTTGESVVRLVLVYPELLGTYGDRGNALVLEQRLRWRGIAVERLEVDVQSDVPAGGDLYVLGGGEDTAQLAALQRLRRGNAVSRACAAGASVLAVCAGLQILGERFSGADDRLHDGLGLVDVRSGRGERRAVGEVVSRPLAPLTQPLTGFANHRGVTHLGPGARPLGLVQHGPGNNGGAGNGPEPEGAVQSSVVGTYLHGPVLARNPELADLLLTAALGELPPLDLPSVEALRTARFAAAASAGRR